MAKALKAVGVIAGIAALAIPVIGQLAGAAAFAAVGGATAASVATAPARARRWNGRRIR